MLINSCFYSYSSLILNSCGFDQVDVGRKVCRSEMEVRASLQKVSGSSDSVTTVNSEEFVLVPQHADDTTSKYDEKPQLKVFCVLHIFYCFFQ